ncbi:hypothetical protein BCR32DRAFT_282344 [Anaeromyces robustus]|uniref:Ankyrin n=1 Tax=Anaeromyces robustus TaxID=1754192 RepID=A0A1Y1WXT2_9FUNG|nr:hypothetical protein BCR32DRAFT_282344 [Anaeromyces robustus]|eukprot:ORX78360.1 hypothetical protein BCR32DRAFT_282344 [Anaeromyces robustus]
MTKDNDYYYEKLYNALSVEKGDFKTIKLLLDYTEENNINLIMNDNSNKMNLLYYASESNNIELAMLLTEYSKKHIIILNIRDKYPISQCAFEKNYIEMIILLLDYINKNNITINIKIGYYYSLYNNEKKKRIGHEEYPLSYTVLKDNIEIVKLLIDYANKYNIFMNVNDHENKNNEYKKIFFITIILKWLNY